MTGWAADPVGLAANAGPYGVHADQVQSIYATLSAALEAEGACWGDDDAGKTFAGKYVTNALNTLIAMSQNGSSMESMVDGIYSWAKNYMSADEAAKDGLTQELGYA
ncbi:MAG: hypothetical protein ACRDNZ_04960 [Streptosporangiaceae bacterium]